MTDRNTLEAPSRQTPDTHQRKADKLKRIPIPVVVANSPLRKPDWIRVRASNHENINRIKRILREQNLHTVCEEAACPNLSECFGHGTATFMILGDICTRRCPFCDVAHGRPKPPNAEEPGHLATVIRELGLRYVVITSVDRDDLRDGGAGHFTACIQAIREETPATKIEILVPDFRGRVEAALATLAPSPPDVFNHNLETVPRLYKAIRPGADYQGSLDLLARFKLSHPNVLTKSGLMLGIGEALDEVEEVMVNLREHHCDMLTIGQYLQPSMDHLPVARYVTPEEFQRLEETAKTLGFSSVASAPMVRSSYHADLQAREVLER
jgi:lipoic acid synthetase